LYIPGYGDFRNSKENKMLKLKADSIEQSLIQKQQYINDIEKVLKGKVLPPDTTRLPLPNVEKSKD
jgi:hypothetical protein